MSVLKQCLHPRAQEDLRSILLYSHARWGAVQRKRYRALLDAGIARLTRHPEMGEMRDDIFPGCRTLRVEQHILFYRVTETEIIVSRVLHVRQDVTDKDFP